MVSGVDGHPDRRLHGAEPCADRLHRLPADLQKSARRQGHQLHHPVHDVLQCRHDSGLHPAEQPQDAQHPVGADSAELHQRVQRYRAAFVLLQRAGQPSRGGGD